MMHYPPAAVGHTTMWANSRYHVHGCDAGVLSVTPYIKAVLLEEPLGSK